MFPGEMDGNARLVPLRVPNEEDCGDRPGGDVDDDDEADERSCVSSVRYGKLGNARLLELEEESR